MSTPRVVCVLGMHRAGTSALARALSAVGVELGDDLVGPARDNPKGFFENVEIVNLNDRLLSQVGHHWCSLGIIDAKEISITGHRDILEEAVEILTRYTSKFPVWGFKDPRTTRLLPFWLEVFDLMGLPVAYVISLRNPPSVVKSLKSRDQLPDGWSQIMWLQHYYSAFRHSEGNPRLVIDYDLLLSDPDAQIRRLASFLQVPVDRSVEDRIKEYSEEFLDPNLCHHDFDSKMVEEAATPVPGLREFYEWALDFAGDKVPAEKPGEKSILDRVDESLQSQSRFLGLLDAVHSQMRQHKAENSRLSLAVSRLLEFLDCPRGRILLLLRLLPRWMNRLDRDAKGKSPPARPLKKVYGRLYSLTLPSGAIYEQPLEQVEAAGEFSIVVPVHDAPDVVGRCFSSLERYASKAEIILVDDGSKMQETRNLIDDYAARNSWKLIRHTAAAGHSRACESGAREAAGRFLCLLNSDTVVTPWSWSAVLAAFESDETIGVAGPSTSWASNEQMIPIASECRHLWTDGQIWAYARRCMASQPPQSWVDLPGGPIGFAFFIRRSLWEQLGGFSIGLPDCGNETDLCMRVKQLGYRLVWVKGSYIHHFGEMSYSRLGDLETRKRWMRWVQFASKRWGITVPDEIR